MNEHYPGIFCTKGFCGGRIGSHHLVFYGDPIREIELRSSTSRSNANEWLDQACWGLPEKYCESPMPIIG